MMSFANVIQTVSSRDQRAIRIGLLVLGPAFCYSLLVRPYVSSTRIMLDAVRSQADLLVREEELAASLPAIRSQVRMGAEAARRTATLTYTGADSMLAMAAFRGDVTTTLEDAGLVMQRVEMRDSLSRQADLRELTVDVRARGDFESILNALARLEANSRLTYVGRINIEKTGERLPSGAEALSLVAIIHAYAQR